MDSLATLEAVKLLKLLEDAARDKVIATGTLHNNIIKATWDVFDNAGHYTAIIAVRLSINGYEFVLKKEIPFYGKPDYKKYEQDVVDFIAVKIAHELVKNASVFKEMAE